MSHYAAADLPPLQRRVLSNPPLQEVVFEFRWALQQSESGGAAGRSFPVDPYYRIAAGRFFDRVSAAFPKYETLPTWEMPDAIASYVVQHRWAPEAGAPILQLGPGVLSVNETRPREYRWEDFVEKCIWTYDVLLQSYPVPLQPHSVGFQYINSIPFDFMRLDAFEYIGTNLNADVIATRRILPASVSHAPVHFQSTQSFRCSSPEGVVSIVFGSILHQQTEKRLAWHLIFESRGSALPNTIAAMSDWLGGSHAVLEEIFFNMIKGNLERAFA